MAKRYVCVSAVMHKSFYDNIYEKKRRDLQQKLKLTNLSHMKFTEYLAKNKAQIIIPKPKKLKLNNPVKKRKYYA